MSKFKSYDVFEQELQLFYNQNENNLKILESKMNEIATSILSLTLSTNSIDESILNELKFLYVCILEILHDNFILKSKINELQGEFKDELTVYTNKKYYVNVLYKYLVSIVNELLLNSEFSKASFVYLTETSKNTIKNQTKAAHNFIEENISANFYDKETKKQHKLGGMLYENIVLVNNENDYILIIKEKLFPYKPSKNITPQNIEVNTNKTCFNVSNMTNENFIEFLKSSDANIVLNINDNLQCYNRDELSEFYKAKMGNAMINVFTKEGKKYYKLYNEEVISEDDYLLIQDDYFCIYNVVLSGKKVSNANIYYNLYTVNPYTISEYLDPRIMNANESSYGYCANNSKSVKQHLLSSDENIIFKFENSKNLICDSRVNIKANKQNIEGGMYYITVNKTKIAVSKSSYKKIQNDKFSIYILHNTRIPIFEDVYQYEIMAYTVNEYFNF